MPKGIYTRSLAQRQAQRAAHAKRRAATRVDPVTFKVRDLCWLAGLMEGEGSFMKGPPSRPWRCQVSIQMCDEDVISRVAGLWGATYWRCNKQRAHHRDSFAVHKRGRGAVELMLALKPLMGARRKQQIEAAIKSFYGR